MNILDLAVKSFIVSIFGLLSLVLMRRSSAATRHLTLALTLFSLCALPVVAPIVPTWHVPFITVPEHATAAVQPAAVPSETAPAPAPNKVPSSLLLDRESATLLLWASVATLLALRVLTRLSRLRGLERRLPMCSQPELQTVVAEYCRTHQRHFLLLEGESNEPPMTWGHTRPVLLLPSVANEWPAERLRSVLLHELAHVERGDWIVSLSAELVCALFWFNPAVWVIRKRLELESESAADDRVLSTGVSRTQYAGHLVELLRDLNHFPRSADAAVAMARPGRLDSRVKAILEERRTRQSVRGSATLGLVALVSTVAIAVGAAGPTVVREVEHAASLKPVSPQTDSSLLDVQGNHSGLTDMDKTEFGEASTKAQPTLPELTKAETGPSRIGTGAIASPHHHSFTVSGGDKSDSIALSNSPKKTSGTDTSVSEDLGDLKVEIPTAEIAAGIRSAQTEARKSIKEANAEMAKAGVHFDIGPIIEGALKEADKSLKHAKLTEKQANEIARKALEEVSKGLKNMPPPDPAHGH